MKSIAYITLGDILQKIEAVHSTTGTPGDTFNYPPDTRDSKADSKHKLIVQEIIDRRKQDIGNTTSRALDAIADSVCSRFHETHHIV